MNRKLFYFILGIPTVVLIILVFIAPAFLAWRPAINYSEAHVLYTDHSTVPLDASSSRQPGCETDTALHEPPCNPYLANSSWSISHYGSYAQGSSALPGPTADQSFLVDHLDLANVAITYAFSSPYSDGGVAAWGALLTIDGVIVKLDHDSFSIIDTYNPQLEEDDLPEQSIGLSGAYTLIDVDNHFMVGRLRSVEVYADSIPGDRYSGISLLKRFYLPDDFFCDDQDALVGLNMSYDGYIVVVTEKGMVGLFPRDIEQMSPENMVRYSINGEACADTDSHRISNNIAVDEDGGIYIVTSREMFRLQWDGRKLTQGWQSPYEAGAGNLSALRIGPGSGSTPSLMGSGADEDQFVVFTDGQELMHLVLMWRDEIPSDWEPIAPGRDRRIACEFPIRFGDPSQETSLSEQSVLVRGYASILVNNLLQNEPPLWKKLPPTVGGLFAVLSGNNADQAPYGIERVDWDPETRTCTQVWANPEISVPNGIPTMSERTGLIYAIGQQEGYWGLAMIDFSTGELEQFVESRQKECSLAAFEQINSLPYRAVMMPVLALNPDDCENSFFAATEIGPDGTIYTGTLLGVSKFTPLEP